MTEQLVTKVRSALKIVKDCASLFFNIKCHSKKCNGHEFLTLTISVRKKEIYTSYKTVSSMFFVSWCFFIFFLCFFIHTGKTLSGVKVHFSKAKIDAVCKSTLLFSHEGVWLSSVDSYTAVELQLYHTNSKLVDFLWPVGMVAFFPIFAIKQRGRESLSILLVPVPVRHGKTYNN